MTVGDGMRVKDSSSKYRVGVGNSASDNSVWVDVINSVGKGESSGMGGISAVGIKVITGVLVGNFFCVRVFDFAGFNPIFKKPINVNTPKKINKIESAISIILLFLDILFHPLSLITLVGGSG